MWVVFGTSEKTERVAGGAKVARHCDHCGETTTFYEKEIHRTFRLYFIDVFDYQRQRVMACGGCSTCYVTDELGGAGADTSTGFGALGNEVGRAARTAGRLLERAGDAVGSQLSSLWSDGPGDTPKVERDAPVRAEPGKSADKPDESEAALEEDLELDPLEAQFRELERKVRVRID